MEDEETGGVSVRKDWEGGGGVEPKGGRVNQGTGKSASRRRALESGLAKRSMN